jgi:hypothetical protein
MKAIISLVHLKIYSTSKHHFYTNISNLNIFLHKIMYAVRYRVVEVCKLNHFKIHNMTTLCRENIIRYSKVKEIYIRLLIYIIF